MIAGFELVGLGGSEMTGLVRFERQVVVQIGNHSPERAVFDVNDAASILLRDSGRQTEKRRAAILSEGTNIKG